MRPVPASPAPHHLRLLASSSVIASPSQLFLASSYHQSCKTNQVFFSHKWTLSRKPYLRKIFATRNSSQHNRSHMCLPDCLPKLVLPHSRPQILSRLSCHISISHQLGVLNVLLTQVLPHVANLSIINLRLHGHLASRVSSSLLSNVVVLVLASWSLTWSQAWAHLALAFSWAWAWALAWALAWAFGLLLGQLSSLLGSFSLLPTLFPECLCAVLPVGLNCFILRKIFATRNSSQHNRSHMCPPDCLPKLVVPRAVLPPFCRPPSLIATPLSTSNPQSTIVPHQHQPSAWRAECAADSGAPSCCQPEHHQPPTSQPFSVSCFILPVLISFFITLI
ncbi:chaperone DnaJ-domain superfamily protein [Striga asiatica]|uniref:Chaperone DnaJ-domain superfamily protein n=1 Tax=Striga asiatica TaxID=4170 RepID=A0A5A7QYW7_STRAF|nr:chaperone DnaJ-domain superfamily protein [Striga asiatica]